MYRILDFVFRIAFAIQEVFEVLQKLVHSCISDGVVLLHQQRAAHRVKYIQPLSAMCRPLICLRGRSREVPRMVRDDEHYRRRDGTSPECLTP
jgi:hypothetical protein